MPEKRSPHHRLVRSRREFLTKAGSGLGGIALSHLLGSEGMLPRGMAAEAYDNTLAPKEPHHEPKAK